MEERRKRACALIVATLIKRGQWWYYVTRETEWNNICLLKSSCGKREREKKKEKELHRSFPAYVHRSFVLLFLQVKQSYLYPRDVTVFKFGLEMVRYRIKLNVKIFIFPYKLEWKRVARNGEDTRSIMESQK